MTNQTYDGALQDQLISQYPNILNADEIKTVANDFLVIIKQGLKKDKQVKITKFGTFKIKKVKDRRGVNPQTGEKIIIKAHNRVFFKPTKALLERINASVLLDVKKTIKDNKQYKVAAKHINNVAQLVIKEETIKDKPKETDNKRILVASLILGIVIAGVVLQFQQPEKQTPFVPKTPVATASIPESTVQIAQNESAVFTVDNSQTTQSNSDLLVGSSIPPIVNHENIMLTTEVLNENLADDVLIDEDVALYDDVMYDEFFVTNNTKTADGVAETDRINSIQNEAQTKIQTLVKNNSVAKPAPYFAKKTYKLKYGDNLWNLAKSNYKAPILWPHIYHDNQKLITNPNKLKTNKKIVIPQLEGEYGKLSDLDKRNVAEGYWLLYEHYKKTGNQFSTFALLGVKQFDSSVIDENKQMISKQDMDDFLAMAEA